MELSQKELAALCPEEIASYIDLEAMPAYADGYHTAEEIRIEMLHESRERIKEFIENPERYQVEIGSLPLIDTWVIFPPNTEIIEAYIQEVFDEWEDENQ